MRDHILLQGDPLKMESKNKENTDGPLDAWKEGSVTASLILTMQDRGIISDKNKSLENAFVRITTETNQNRIYK
jgi:hypothetical protein